MRHTAVTRRSFLKGVAALGLLAAAPVSLTRGTPFVAPRVVAEKAGGSTVIRGIIAWWSVADAEEYERVEQLSLYVGKQCIAQWSVLRHVNLVVWLPPDMGVRVADIDDVTVDATGSPTVGLATDIGMVAARVQE